MSRKGFAAAMATTVIVAAGAPAVAQAPAPAPAYSTTKIADGVYQFAAGNYRSMFVVTPAGVLVTDPISYSDPNNANVYIAEIRKITQAPIRYMVYSHLHFDHTTGGKPFKDAGATVIGHERLTERLIKTGNTNVVMPDEVVSDAGRTIDLGGTKIELVYPGRIHSDNMLVVYVPSQKVVYTADLPGGGNPPAAGMGDFYPREYEASLRKIGGLGWDKMISGHPTPRPVTPADMNAVADYLDDVAMATKASSGPGRNCPEGAGKLITPAKYNWTGADAQARVNGQIARYCTWWSQGY